MTYLLPLLLGLAHGVSDASAGLLVGITWQLSSPAENISSFSTTDWRLDYSLWPGCCSTGLTSPGAVLPLGCFAPQPVWPLPGGL